MSSCKISFSSHTLIVPCTHPAARPPQHSLSKDLFKTNPRSKAHSAPFCIWAQTGEREWFSPKMKTWIHGRAGHWSQIITLHHVQEPSPSLQATNTAPLPHAAQGRSKSLMSWRAMDLPGWAARHQPAASGWTMTNQQGPRSTSCCGLTRLPRSSSTSPPPAILGCGSASEAGRKIASSTAAPFCAASPLGSQTQDVRSQKR